MLSVAWFHAFHVTPNTYNFWALVLAAAQTVILFATGVVVAIYTWATNKQLEIARQQFEEAKLEKRREAQPLFVVSVARLRRNDELDKPLEARVTIINKRAPAHGLQIESYRSIDWRFSGGYQYFDGGATETITFFRKAMWVEDGGMSPDAPEKFNFSISYRTVYEAQHTISYTINGAYIMERGHSVRVESQSNTFEEVDSVGLNPVPDYSVEPRRHGTFSRRWLRTLPKRCGDWVIKRFMAPKSR